MGKSSLLAAITTRAKELSFRVGHGTSAPVEGAWPYAPIVEALADLCRRHPTLLDGLADHHRDEIDRALAGAEISWTGESSHQRLFVAAAELVRLASATTASCSPSTTSTTPTTPACASCTTSPGRRVTNGCAS